MSTQSAGLGIELVTDSLRPTDHMGILIRSDGKRAKWDGPSLVRLLEKHRSGMKNSDIGAEYGVSGEQIRQLIQRAKKREESSARQNVSVEASTRWAGAVFGDLSVRVCNCLLAADLVSVEDVMRVHKEGKLNRVPNLGRDRVLVEQWLSKQPQTT
jgi:hypothetical protein